jgi:hypothetical protein
MELNSNNTRPLRIVAPPPVDTALNRVWRLAIENLTTPAEFDQLAELARIRGVWTAGVSS